MSEELQKLLESIADRIREIRTAKPPIKAKSEQDKGG